MEKHYDLAVIGAGPGGYVAAIKAAQLGKKVVLIECLEVGGTCLNRGCIPTKTLMHSSHLFYEASHMSDFGIELESIRFDYDKMQQRKDEVVKNLRTGVSNLLKSNKVEVINGIATIEKNHQISIAFGDETETLEADHILIATGSKPAVPPIQGVHLPNVVTSDELLSSQGKLYQRLLIIGGGVIGVEFATIYRELGCEVTIIEAQDRILPTMDKEISQSLTMSLKKKGTKIITSARVEKIEEIDGLCCHYLQKEQEQEVSADGILLSIGRKANTDRLFGEGLELIMDRDKIEVNERFETSIPSIYAIGDVVKGMQLAHAASAQGIVAVEQMFGHNASIDLSVIPSCIYTNPEIASVGIMEEEAKKKDIAVKVGKVPMLGNCKTILCGEERGFIKAIFDANSDVLIGAQLMCSRATDMVGEFATAIVNKLTSKDLASVIRPHPTYEESITEENLLDDF
ncbi:MAG: hypothetical protein K0S47_4465 [Herbinix sp.]|nr:hypothetical protein [Herbinix sp.]